MSSQSARRRRARQGSQDRQGTVGTRRKADPIADRMAARTAIHAQYDEAATAAFERASATVHEAWAQCGREQSAAWAERCRKLGELEGRPIPTEETPEAIVIRELLEASDEAELEAARNAGTDRLAGELERQAHEEDR